MEINQTYFLKIDQLCTEIPGILLYCCNLEQYRILKGENNIIDLSSLTNKEKYNVLINITDHLYMGISQLIMETDYAIDYSLLYKNKLRAMENNSMILYKMNLVSMANEKLFMIINENVNFYKEFYSQDLKEEEYVY